MGINQTRGESRLASLKGSEREYNHPDEGSIFIGLRDSADAYEEIHIHHDERSWSCPITADGAVEEITAEQGNPDEYPDWVPNLLQTLGFMEAEKA